MPHALPTHTNTHCTQGVDLIAGGRNKKTHRTAPKSDNVYLKLLVKVRDGLVWGCGWLRGGSSVLL